MQRKFSKIKKKKGFTLLEVIIAVFITVLVMVASSQLFAQAIVGYRNARVTQKDLENAQYLINLMAKTIRTSSVLDSNSSYINIYDYSQDKCIRYEYDSGNKKIKSSFTNPSTPGDKDTCSFGTSLSDLSNIYVNGVKFYVTPSSSGVVGKVTIVMEICATSGCAGTEKDKVRIQTSVSLRDYSEVGL